ncbi:MAG: hypothetical protein JRI25_26985, partial [Deltaproteobacteria bacterium]|nr:hypothetical protein [Deltaproteobacteria bacterium]
MQAVATGTTTITATNEGFVDAANLTVAISSGAGFLQGEVYDDRAGLPLARAMATLLADGSGSLEPPVTTTADAQGRFLLEGLQGEALVRLEQPGYTGVDRRGVIPGDTASTLLDARLTPLDAQIHTITSALGGEVSDTAGSVTLVFPPGSVAAVTDIRVTALSNQGLPGRLPLGWSPIAAVDVRPFGLTLAQPARLRVPNHLNLLPDSQVTIAVYDPQGHQWVVQTPAQVTADGQDIAVETLTTGQWVWLLPDAAPFAPAAPVVGEILQGVDGQPLPDDLTASGEVLPPVAPPGEDARATGEIVVAS